MSNSTISSRCLIFPNTNSSIVHLPTAELLIQISNLNLNFKKVETTLHPLTSKIISFLRVPISISRTGQVKNQDFLHCIYFFVYCLKLYVPRLGMFHEKRNTGYLTQTLISLFAFVLFQLHPGTSLSCLLSL